VLLDAVLAGSAAFRAGGGSPTYLEAVKDGPWSVERLEQLSAEDVDGLVLLVNRWRTRYPSSTESRAALLGGLCSVVPQLQSLVGVTLLDADFEGPSGDATDAAFSAIVAANPRKGLTAASKFLHVVNPELFVMWDAFIRPGWGITSAPAELNPPVSAYARVYLPRMQMLARRVLREYAERHGVSVADAQAGLCPPGCTLAKLVDEYGYARFTLRDPAVWAAEYS
jgi:hypothetical protein